MSDMTQSGAPVRAGDLLAGKYRVERVLGSGGMGVVVAARHEQLDQRVAIKFVRDDALGNKEAVARFVFEARAVVKLKSEHVAKVLDVGTLDSGAPYMVMELLEGSDLADILDKRGPLPVAEAVEHIVQACEALAEAHAAGIIHRDLKPNNLFLAEAVGGATKIKVLDFGVSKSQSISGSGAGGLTSTSTMIGSPLYMSPEQMRSSRDVDPRADVWALGVVLFELLAKATPFEADNMPELCLKVVSEPPRSLAALRPDIPSELVAIVGRCLAKDPSKRYANAAELATALAAFTPPRSQIVIERARRAMGSQPSIETTGSNPAPSRIESTAATVVSQRDVLETKDPRAKRGPQVWIALAAVVGLLGVGAAVTLRRSGDPPSAAAPSPAPPPILAASTAVPLIASPPPSASAPVVLAAAASLAPSAREATSAPSPRAGASARPAAPRAPKASAHDDDIPALR